MIGHGAKGHQNALGKVLAVGVFESTFSAETYEDPWKDSLRRNLDSIRKKLQQETFGAGNLSEEDQALRLHSQCMNVFYGGLGPTRYFISHSACFCCLREMPAHALPCGHVLCTKCVKSYGKTLEKYWVSMRSCPLHVKETASQEGHLIRFKPRNSGVRILTLDGGGIRGIIELEVLRTIEKSLGGKIPIQAFFDLIVGTSTGGIIALGLGVAGWSVSHCSEKFKRLVGKAFTPRDFHGLPLFRSFAFMHHHSLYKTRPFEEALREAFDKDIQMFNGGQAQDVFRTKVAVTSSTGTGQSAVVIANYNRTEGDDSEQDYIFERPERLEEELMVWQAARATSAAPKYFKPFQSNVTRKEYWDGALWHNNPVFVANHERKLLWPDTANAHPDIILSIGTGFKANTATENRPRALLNRALSHETGARPEPMKKWAQRPRWQQLFSTLINRAEDILNADRIWSTFMMDMEVNTGLRRRYQRINVDLGKDPPELDAVDQVEDLQATVAYRLKTVPEYKVQLGEIAHQLVASSFYFEKAPGHAVDPSVAIQIFGTFRCRFLSGSQELRHLGELLRTKQIPGFQPFFSVLEQDDYQENTWPQRFTLQEDVINGMIARAIFEHPQVGIDVSKQGAKTTVLLHLDGTGGALVSGFPRPLLDNENQDLSRVPSATSTPHSQGQRWPPPESPASSDGIHHRSVSGPAVLPVPRSGPTHKASGRFLTLRRRPSGKAQDNASTKSYETSSGADRAESISNLSQVSLPRSVVVESSDNYSLSSGPPRYSEETDAGEQARGFSKTEIEKAIEASLADV
ncbi:hypothetical protein LTR56_001704 [Elasticomyces elasticus]|nr:hypothetical protein LTR56_001704 [Elasticomyces elasticus]KAK3667245.1 hypothetical protein LTR22_001761 [Elasticomyces elasticus]KAK5769698.1 hypothetical protein LTS12_000148 [Elasticomyces elasticus]